MYVLFKLAFIRNLSPVLFTFLIGEYSIFFWLIFCTEEESGSNFVMRIVDSILADRTVEKLANPFDILAPLFAFAV